MGERLLDEGLIKVESCRHFKKEFRLNSLVKELNKEMGRWVILGVETASTKNKMFPHEKYEVPMSSALNKEGPITFLRSMLISPTFQELNTSKFLTNQMSRIYPERACLHHAKERLNLQPA